MKECIMYKRKGNGVHHIISGTYIQGRRKVYKIKISYKKRQTNNDTEVRFALEVLSGYDISLTKIEVVQIVIDKGR